MVHTQIIGHYTHRETERQSLWVVSSQNRVKPSVEIQRAAVDTGKGFFFVCACM